MARLGVTVFAAVAAAAISACEPSTEPGVPDGAVQLATQEVPQEVAQYLYSGIPDRRRLYIDNATAWTELWTQVVRFVQPAPPVPQIDFANEAVIVAAMGGRATGGYSIEIKGVFEADGKVFVAVTETSPGDNCITTQALTAPVHAVRAPRRSASIEFVESKETRTC